MTKRMGREDRRRVLAEYLSSGMTRSEFCEQHQISLTTLESWKRIERRLGKRQLLGVKIESKADRAAPEQHRGFTLNLGNGRQIESSWQFPEADLARLIRVTESV